MSNKQNDIIEEMKNENLWEEATCDRCGCENNQHQCSDCEQEISQKECKEYEGLCEQCMWLLDK